MVTIGIIGDYNPEQETHRATNDALQHAARALGTPIAVSWISTLDLGVGGTAGSLVPHDGLWAAPASPYRCMEGALNGIRFAREQGWPFFGT